VILYTHLNFDSHAKSVVASCSSYIHALHHICKVMSEDIAKTIACIVSVRLDYCNALLHGAPATTTNKLQRHKTLAQFSNQSTHQTPSRPLLQSLHWLPVQECIDYKVAVLTYKVQTTSTPPYLDSLLHRHINTRSLQLTNAPRLVVPRTRTELARRAFSASDPFVWNGLPKNI